MKARRSFLPTEVFLSHSGRDRAFANKLANELRRHRVPVWYSVTNIVGAQEWHDEIGRALLRCDWFLVVLSPHSVKSEWVKRELTFAPREARYRNRVIPVIRKPCDEVSLSWTLPGFQHIDFAAGFRDGLQELLRLWGVGYVPRKPVTCVVGSPREEQLLSTTGHR